MESEYQQLANEHVYSEKCRKFIEEKLNPLINGQVDVVKLLEGNPSIDYSESFRLKPTLSENTLDYSFTGSIASSDVNLTKDPKLTSSSIQQYLLSSRRENYGLYLCKEIFHKPHETILFFPLSHSDICNMAKLDLEKLRFKILKKKSQYLFWDESCERFLISYYNTSQNRNSFRPQTKTITPPIQYILLSLQKYWNSTPSHLDKSPHQDTSMEILYLYHIESYEFGVTPISLLSTQNFVSKMNEQRNTIQNRQKHSNLKNYPQDERVISLQDRWKNYFIKNQLFNSQIQEKYAILLSHNQIEPDRNYLKGTLTHEVLKEIGIASVTDRLSILEMVNKRQPKKEDNQSIKPTEQQKSDKDRNLFLLIIFLIVWLLLVGSFVFDD